MSDQAEELRKAMQAQGPIKVYTESATQSTRVVAVVSGKGGVGKSNFCVNFAFGLAQAGSRPVILDADMGFANVEVLLGVQPQYTLLNLLEGKEIWDVVQQSPIGVPFISAGTGIANLHTLTNGEMDLLAEQLKRLHERFDVVLIDSGGGTGGYLGYLLSSADELVLVTTPEPTSIADAYALLKMLRFGPGLPPTKLVVNRTRTFSEGRLTAEKLRLAAERFLQTKLGTLGYVLEDGSVSESVMRQQVLLRTYPKSSSAQCIRQLVHNYLNVETTQVKQGITGFIERWLRRLRHGGETHANPFS